MRLDGAGTLRDAPKIKARVLPEPSLLFHYGEAGSLNYFLWVYLEDFGREAFWTASM